MTTEANPQAAKSGMRQLKTGEVLFNDGDYADSLFIIQKGQIRLYKPKGKGFIEIGTLRQGEVIGEMAYFDEDGSGKNRSCSAAALTPVEVIEISFAAFGKTMASLNPWFKTIINTLASRLRKTNSRVRELEDSQAVQYGAKAGQYEFLRTLDVMKILGTLYLVFKAHGEMQGLDLIVPNKTLTLYTSEMYQIQESKLANVLQLLKDIGWLDQVGDNLSMKNIDAIRQVFTYYNTERHLPEDKKLKIGDRCELLIAKMIEKGDSFVTDIPNMKIDEDNPPKFTKQFLISPILEEFKAKNIPISTDLLKDGKSVALFGEPLLNDGKTYVEVDFPKVQKLYPVIKWMNSVRRSNGEKST